MGQIGPISPIGPMGLGEAGHACGAGRRGLRSGDGELKGGGTFEFGERVVDQRFWLMTMPVMMARVAPVVNRMVVELGGRRLRTNQPVAAPAASAIGTVM